MLLQIEQGGRDLCVKSHYFVVFFFKQKTAYEMRISDWSSDVCSSDLPYEVRAAGGGASCRRCRCIMSVTAGPQADELIQRRRGRCGGIPRLRGSGETRSGSNAGGSFPLPPL